MPIVQCLMHNDSVPVDLLQLFAVSRRSNLERVLKSLTRRTMALRGRRELQIAGNRRPRRAIVHQFENTLLADPKD